MEVQTRRKNSPLGWRSSTVNGPQAETSKDMPMWLNLALKLGSLLANQFFSICSFWVIIVLI
jgi:hypothetical protein